MEICGHEAAVPGGIPETGRGRTRAQAMHAGSLSSSCVQMCVQEM